MNEMDIDTPAAAAEVTAGAVVTHASRLMVQAFSASQRELNLAPAQYRIIIELSRREKLTQKDLIAKLDIEQSTIGNTLNRMEQGGLIERKPHPNDGRAQILCLTPHAIELREKANIKAKLLNQKALSTFSDDEKTQFFELMNKLIKTLKNEA